MQQKGTRYKTDPFILWSKLCLKLQLSCKLLLQFRDHDDFDAGLDVAVDLDGDLMGTEGFYGLCEADAAPVEVDAAGVLYGVGDVGGGNGTEEPLVLAGTGLDGDDALVEDLGYLRGPIGEATVALHGLLHLVAGLFELGGGRHLGEAAGDEEVTHVAPAHVHDVAPLSDLLDVLGQYHLHGLNPLPAYHVGQQRHLAGALDCGRRLALVLRAEAGHPASTDLAAVRGEPPQHVVVLVVDVVDVLLAEHARLALGRARPSGRSAPSPTHSDNLLILQN